MTVELRNDGLDPAELTTLGAIELGLLLNDIDHQTAAFTRVATDGWRTIGDAEKSLLKDPHDLETIGLIAQTKAYLKAAEIQLRALRQRQSRIQTILRTLGPAL